MEKKEKRTIQKKVGVTNWMLLGVLLIYTLTMFLLFLWGISASLKTRAEWIYDRVWFPDGPPWKWGWSNYKDVLSAFFVEVTKEGVGKVRIKMLGLLINTLLYSGVSAVVITAAYCITAYLVAKYNYWFSKVVYTFVLRTMVIPIIGSTPATLLVLNQLHIFDTWLGNYITKFNFLGMYFLVFHAAFSGVSNEYYEAATINGANEYQIFFRIMVPLVLPTCNTIFIIKFIEFWNDYQTPILFMPTHPTLAYGVYRMAFLTENESSRVMHKLASCMLLAVPILVLFIAFRNKILGNVSMGGVKE